MVAANLLATDTQARRKHARAILGLVACLVSAWQPLTLHAQAPPREDGLFISVPSPITRDVVNRVKMSTERAFERKDRAIKKIIYDFTPNNAKANTTREYGDCRDLAAYLLRLKQIKTVAFFTGEVSGHAVLPVLACQELVMGHDARLGNVLRDHPEPLDEDQIHFYENLSRGRASPAIVLKMLDRDMEVFEGTRNDQGGTLYLDKRREAEFSKQGMRILAGRAPVLPRGVIGFYSASDALKFGLCDLIKDTRAEVAEQYNLEPSSLRGDPLEGREPKAERFILNEHLGPAFAETLERRIRQSIARGANVLVFQLEARGGDTQVARDLAEYLRELKDDNGDLPVMTIAYIPDSAPGAMTFFALGCSEIVMRNGAKLGDFQEILQTQGGKPGEEHFKLMEESLAGLCREQGYSPLIARGMIEPALTIYRVRGAKTGEIRLVTEEELKEDKAGRWDQASKSLVKAGGPQGELLVLDAEKARDLGVARKVVDSPEELYEFYGLKRVRDAGFDFLYSVAKFLRHPAMAIFLVLIGISCLILELKMPGVSLPGIIAALCFVLYFWSHSQLVGQIIWLAVLLFVLGLILLALEIFVIPGFGVTGVSGILLIVASLALVTVEKKPETRQEWVSFTRTIGTLGVTLIGSFFMAMILAWYLPHVPWVNRLILKSARRPEEAILDDAGIMMDAETAALLGSIGVAETTLRPAGMARFGDRFVDVVSEGGFIQPGGRIQVIEIEGNRVVVKEVS